MRLDAEAPRAGEAWLGFGAGAPGRPAISAPAATCAEAAANLFAYLRAADRSRRRGHRRGPDPARTGLGEAINDRLRRAAGFVG